MQPMTRWAQSEVTHHEEVRIMQAARDDLSRFEPLYERYFVRIYRYCLRRVENAEAAEDLTSLIFANALSGVQSYTGGSVAAWLFRIAHNALANHYRSRRPSVSLEQVNLDWADESGEPLEGILLLEQQQLLALLVRQLPHESRDVLSLKIEGGLSAEEIGAVLGKSAGAVRVELHRIIKGLRAECQERGWS